MREGKIKEFFEEKTEKIAAKIERTPMEKFFVFFLILITVTALTLGYLQMKKNIESPLYSSYMRAERGKIQEKYQIPDINLGDSIEQSKLKAQDSDLDGLDDYSEIYIYGTNPYMEDTDGDGIWDKQEIQRGTNPNCPEGQNCEIQSVLLGGNEDMEIINLNQVAGYPASLNSNFNDFLGIQAELLKGDISLEELGITDPEMQKLFEMMKTGQAVDTSQLSAEEKNQVLNTLKNLQPEDIREELIKRGIDKSVLDQVDNETLEDLFFETLNLYNK